MYIIVDLQTIFYTKLVVQLSSSCHVLTSSCARVVAVNLKTKIMIVRTPCLFSAVILFYKSCMFSYGLLQNVTSGPYIIRH